MSSSILSKPATHLVWWSDFGVKETNQSKNRVKEKNYSEIDKQPSQVSIGA
ncbi:hypothetical protein HanXRQr2_Chr06g0253261 [Helianthus annuus]|uniref:Uncharacterized protein n=1 Tax=Helianthus annuus TaxID=4232 RepID=A0A251UK58_HELAN|nr:hypothetical protein HanXRQr2_Chr06g0253261 [Helianthus annuus]KAJ0560122.1 hypothetical protein HanHA300_Chr06g0207971 [Helianthus annuus]KAJ0573119.1 hypothetical protein HanHA89_Chr06g0223271 [Helianthus annuus]